jgi:hypothetical protein
MRGKPIILLALTIVLKMRRRCQRDLVLPLFIIEIIVCSRRAYIRAPPVRRTERVAHRTTITKNCQLLSTGTSSREC